MSAAILVLMPETRRSPTSAWGRLCSLDPGCHRIGVDLFKPANTGVARIELAFSKPAFTACGNIDSGTSSVNSFYMLKRSLLFAIPFLAAAACGIFPESNFLLSDASRLPRWFSLDAGLSRSQVTVEMSYYIFPLGGTATFVLKQRDGSVIAKAKGKMRGDHPVYLGPPTTDPLRQYPSYEVVTVNGISEAIEHRAMEPMFYIADDPVILNRLGIAASNIGAPR